MVNFEQLVKNVLLNEGITNIPWFDELLTKHDKLKYGSAISEQDLSDFFDLLDDSKISETQELSYRGKLRVLDIMKYLYKKIQNKPKDLQTFLSQLDTFEKDPNLTKIKSLTKKTDWNFLTPEIKELEQRIEKLAGQKGADTLISEYGNDFIIPAVQRIVKKRVDVFTSLARLQPPSKPFNSLILDVFKYPQQYKSGTKKYTSDFEEVDKFYIDNLIEIALAAQNFYVSEMARIKLSPEQLGGFLESFTLWVGSILNEAEIPSALQAGLARANKISSQPAQQTVNKDHVLKNIAASKFARQSSNFNNKQISPQVVEDLKQKELQNIPNKILYFSGQPIKFKKFKVVNPNEIQETDKEITITPLKVSQISKLKTPEAMALTQALSRVAEYTKKKPGVGERMKQLGSAADAAMAAMGVKLYGG